ncbi:MAG: endonuclease [Bacteroidetes bacterium QH_6_64_77]|nr:MAG: endonuclease [Bacteroidetes bacterium QH_6_64_77]
MRMSILLVAVAAFFVTGTVLPLFSHDHWVVRFFDFPRVQLAMGIGLTLAGFVVARPSSPAEIGAMAVLGLCLVYQVYHILPYTLLSPRQVKRAASPNEETDSLSLLIANVEIENRNPDPLLDLIDEEDPDLVLTLETDAWWMKQLRPLQELYPHAVRHPRENAYGMCLYSRYPLVAPTVRFLVEDDVPSIHTRVELPSGTHVWIHGMHPRPPHPTREPDTTDDVSWSYTTRLFQKISGLLDPRIGRGLYNTFHARYPLLRYPLDHAFHSEHFLLSQLKVLPYIGSDHFPVLIELDYHPDAENHHDEPEANGQDEAQAQHELEKLKEKRNSD